MLGELNKLVIKDLKKRNYKYYINIISAIKDVFFIGDCELVKEDDLEFIRIEIKDGFVRDIIEERRKVGLEIGESLCRITHGYIEGLIQSITKREANVSMERYIPEKNVCMEKLVFG